MEGGRRIRSCLTFRRGGTHRRRRERGGGPSRGRETSARSSRGRGMWCAVVRWKTPVFSKGLAWAKMQNRCSQMRFWAGRESSPTRWLDSARDGFWGRFHVDLGLPKRGLRRFSWAWLRGRFCISRVWLTRPSRPTNITSCNFRAWLPREHDYQTCLWPLARVKICACL
jgi:hypothetical protein